MRILSRLLWLAAALALALLLPNLLWLGSSTVRIHNTTDTTIAEVGYVACDETHLLGTFEPGRSVFRRLASCGDDTLEILVGDTRHCQAYVEGSLYHTIAELGGGDTVACDYSDLLSSLYVVEALR